jgi:hypothetical protein
MQPTTQQWTVAELAYMAGIIDGEGHVGLTDDSYTTKRWNREALNPAAHATRMALTDQMHRLNLRGLAAVANG